jgi:hypothetical protein
MCGFSFPVEIKINKCAQDLRKPFQSTCPSTHGTCSILRTRFNSIASYACYHTGGGTIGTFSARISHSYHRVADSVRKVVKRVKLLGMNVSDALEEPAFHHLRRVHLEGLTLFDVGFSFPMLAHRVPVVFGGSLRRHLPRSIGGFCLEDVVHTRRPYKTREFKLLCFLDTLLHI